MKTTILYILIAVFFISIYSCEKNEYIASPLITVGNISPNTAKHGDTITVAIEYRNCEPNESLKVIVGNVPAEIIDYNDGRTIKVKVPENIEHGGVEIILSNIECWGNSFEKIEDTRFTSITPSEGNAGTRVTIKGFDFIVGYHTRIMIGSMICPLISLTDTMAVIEVPEGCGSGYVRIVSDDQENWCSEHINFNGPVFTYQFEHKKQMLSHYIENGYTVSYERDAWGRAIKKSTAGSYELYKYGSDGLIDTVYSYFSSNSLKGYDVFSNDGAGTLIEYKHYDYTGEFSYSCEYHYSEGRLVQYNGFVEKDGQPGELRISTSVQYTYNENHCNRILRYFNDDGSIQSEHEYYITYDLHNPVVDEGIPGLPYDHSYNIISVNSNKYNKLVFNKYGNLQEVLYKTDACGEFTITNQYYYE